MKTTVLLLCALALTAPAKWLKVAQTNEATFYLRNERPQETDEGTLLAWSKQEFRADTPEGRSGRTARVKLLKGVSEKGDTYAYTLILDEYDCRRGLLRPHKMTDYGAGGDMLNESNEDDLKEGGNYKWDMPAPDTVDEKIMQRVCLAPDHES